MSKTKTTPEPVQTFDEVLASATAQTRSVRVCLRADLLAELDAAIDALSTAMLRNESSEDLAKDVVARTHRARDAETRFAFQSMGRKAWRELIAAHPPTEEQKLTGADFNVDTLPAVAMAACCVAPTGASEEVFAQLAANLTDGQWNEIWAACHAANTAGAEVPLNVAAFALASRVGDEP